MLLALSATALFGAPNCKPCPQACVERDPCDNSIFEGAYATADFIWWKTHIGSMDYALSGINDAGTNVPNFTNVGKGTVFRPDFEFKPGFKVGFGLDFTHDGWDLFAEYTWLNGGEHKNSFTAKEGVGAASSFNVVGPTGIVEIMSVQSGSSKWKQNFNVIDLMLGKSIPVCRYLTLKPSFGLKTAWIHEKFIIDYLPTTVQFASSGRLSAQQKRFQNMWGIGARFGLDGVWRFTRNWGIFGNLDATALWSDFHLKAKTTTLTEVIPGVPPAIATTNLNNAFSIQQIMAVIETGIGLTFMTCFCDDQYQFLFRAGWEEQVWLNFNHFVENIKSGDLSLHGLTLRTELVF